MPTQIAAVVLEKPEPGEHAVDADDDRRGQELRDGDGLQVIRVAA